MKKIDRFIIWICSHFTRSEIESIIKGLSDVLANRNPDVKPKDDFKEKHPNYRNFFVDPNPPLTQPPEPTKPKLNWKELLSDYHYKHGHPLKPVNPKNSKTKIPQDSILSILVLHHHNICILTMVRNALRLNAKSVALYLKSTLAIVSLLNSSALIVNIPSSYGNNVRTLISISVIMTTALTSYITKRNLISPKNSSAILDILNSNLDINSENISLQKNNSPILPPL